MLSTCQARVFLDLTTYLEAEIAKDAGSAPRLDSERTWSDRDPVHQCLLCVNDLGRHFALLCA